MAKTRICPHCHRRFKRYLLSGLSPQQGTAETMCDECVRARIFGIVTTPQSTVAPEPPQPEGE